MTELPRWVLTHAEKLKKLELIHVDLRRSLQMHPWLVLGVTAPGAALAILYLVTSWPETVTPALFVSIVFNAAVILLSAFVIGIAAAVVLRSLDQKVYNGADIEQMLGVEPMVELPDLGELSGEETRELLLPLVGGIIHACSDDALRRCIFTGTGPGTGVTAIATKTKETLEAIGRPVVLMDAAGATPGVPDAEIGGDEATDDGSGRRESLILTETAPLVSSADTEYLARFADCVIVVAESGVTTREQLRNTVKSLQRLNVTAVGFVLNHVKEPRASVELRRSAAASDIASAQFSVAIQRALAQPPSRAEISAITAPRPQPAASLTRGRETPKPATPLANAKRAPQSTAWEQPGIPRWLSDALGELEAPHPEQMGGQPADVLAEKSRQQTMVGDAGKRPVEAGLPQVMLDRNGGAARTDEADAEQSPQNSKDPNGGNGIKPATEQVMRLPMVEEPLSQKPSRLSGLRGIVSTAHLRELRRPEAADETRPQPDDAATEQAGNDLPAALFAPAETGNGFSARLGDLRGLIKAENLKDLNQSRPPLPGSDVVVKPGNGLAIQGSEPASPAHAQPSTDRPVEAEAALPSGDLEQTSMMISETNGAKATAEAKDTDVPAKPTVASDRDGVSSCDEVQVLPSRRGQYRRK
jgi:hypothetical protein